MPQPLFASLARCASLLMLGLPLTLVSACSDEEASPSAQPQVEAGSDASQDASPDVTPGEDAGLEAAAEADADAPLTEDVAIQEAGEDSEVAQDAGPDSADAPVAQLGSVSVPALVTELTSKDFLLINVHVPYAGEIPQTDANLTYEDVPAIEAYIGADLGKKVVLYCYSNYMSTLAGNQLVSKGYWNLRYLDGGLGAWKNAGQPVEYHDQ